MRMEDERDMWKRRTRQMQEEQAEVMHHYHECFSPLKSGEGFKALERAEELLDKYDSGWRDRIEPRNLGPLDGSKGK